MLVSVLELGTPLLTLLLLCAFGVGVPHLDPLRGVASMHCVWLKFWTPTWQLLQPC
jgi:hypothetical protein